MPKVAVNGVEIYYEETGTGTPMVFSHEFAGDGQSWEPQVRFFARRYRVITYNARGYPPSGEPTAQSEYRTDRVIDDLLGLMDHLDIEDAHLVGLSMGGYVVLTFGLAYPQRARSLVVAGAGGGSDDPGAYRERADKFCRRLEAGDLTAFSEFAHNPNRLRFVQKDERGWQEFADRFTVHSPLGSALTFRGIVAGRPPIYSLEAKLRSLYVPTLIVVGDEDAGCIKPGLFMKACIPRSGLAVFPQTGHLLNLEEPALFNAAVLNFVTEVESGKWLPVK